MIHVSLTPLLVLGSLLTYTLSFRLNSQSQTEFTQRSSFSERAFFVPGVPMRPLAPPGARTWLEHSARPPPIVMSEMPKKPAQARFPMWGSEFNDRDRRHLDWGKAVVGRPDTRLTMSGSFSGDDISGQPPEQTWGKPPQLPLEDWPAAMRGYRFVDCGVEGCEYVSSVSWDTSRVNAFKTPDKYQGTRTDGVYKGSYRVMFNLPGQSLADPDATRDSDEEAREDFEAKTVELLKSNDKDNPSFGAVEVKLPMDVKVQTKDLGGEKRLVVTSVGNGNAQFSRIQRGDIIRAVSMPASDRTVSEKPWWGKVFQTEVPAAEQGMVMLDGMGASEYDAVMQENKREKTEAIVLVIERPFFSPLDDDPDFWGGFPMLAFPKGKLQPSLVPIPIPIDPPRGPGGGLPPQGYPEPRDNPFPTPPGPGFFAVDRFQMAGATDLSDPPSDPIARGEDENQKKKQNERKVNVGEGLDSLWHDLPHMLEFDPDTQEWSQFNWNIYTQDLLTDYTTVDPLVLRLLRANDVVAPRKMFDADVVSDDEPAAVVLVKGLKENQQLLEDFRLFVRRFVDRSHTTASTKMGVDPFTGAEIIESRWTVKLYMKRLTIPQWVANVLGMSEPLSPEGIVIVEGNSRFHLDAEGKIYRHAIDKLNLRGVDQEGNRNSVLEYWINAGFPPAGGLAPA